jgi:hypothetical protein
MKCIKCGGEVLPGNSRVIKRNDRSLRQHRVCPERIAGSVDKNHQARSPSAKSSEPRPVNQVSVSQNQMPPGRFYIEKWELERMYQRSSGVITLKMTTQITAVDPEIADTIPDMLEGYVEFKAVGK